MPLPEYTRDQFDARLQDLEDALSNYADFDTRRDREFGIVIGEYWKELLTANDDFVRDSNFASPVSTGTETINTTIGDFFEIALPTGQVRIAGDTIFLKQGTAKFMPVSRITLADIDTATTHIGFYENKGKIILYAKEGEFIAPGSLVYNFYRWLDNVLALGTSVLDIKPEDFEMLAGRVSERMVA
jgi:hypothetical protein